VTDMTNMFYSASEFNNNISSWDVSSVKDMTWMFGYASSFNSDIASWDISDVKSMENMFEGASLFNNDLSSWVSSLGPTSSPTVTFIPIEGSTCSDTCGSKRELVNNNNIQVHVL